GRFLPRARSHARDTLREGTAHLPAPQAGGRARPRAAAGSPPAPAGVQKPISPAANDSLHVREAITRREIGFRTCAGRLHASPTPLCTCGEPCNAGEIGFRTCTARSHTFADACLHVRESIARREIGFCAV